MMPAQSSETPGSPAVTVLVVEDHEASAEGYAQALRNGGYRVQCAKDGYETLSRLTQSPPDVVVLDLKLPKMDGWELLQRLKGNRTGAEIHVVVVTGDPLPTHHELATSLGASVVLVKPVTPQDLLSAVQRALVSGAQV